MLKVNRRRFECNALAKGWTREEIVRRTGLSAGKVDVFYYRFCYNIELFVRTLSPSSSPAGKKFRSKPQMIRHFADNLDLSAFDYRTGKNLSSLKKNRKKLQPEHGRLARADMTLSSPIRQTASIFKQPVTIVKPPDCKVKHEVKHGQQERPRQLFWEKRLEDLTPTISNDERNENPLPAMFKPVGPCIKGDTALQSLVSALHTVTQGVSITGQTGSKSALEKNVGVFLNPEQPLVQTIVIMEEDIRKQEERVVSARLKLQEALRCL
nr:EOG090X0BDJ [Leptodora kindtii]